MNVTKPLAILLYKTGIAVVAVTLQIVIFLPLRMAVLARKVIRGMLIFLGVIVTSLLATSIVCQHALLA